MRGPASSKSNIGTYIQYAVVLIGAVLVALLYHLSRPALAPAPPPAAGLPPCERMWRYEQPSPCPAIDTWISEWVQTVKGRRGKGSSENPFHAVFGGAYSLGYTEAAVARAFLEGGHARTSNTIHLSGKGVHVALLRAKADALKAGLGPNSSVPSISVPDQRELCGSCCRCSEEGEAKAEEGSERTRQPAAQAPGTMGGVHFKMDVYEPSPAHATFLGELLKGVATIHEKILGSGSPPGHIGPANTRVLEKLSVVERPVRTRYEPRESLLTTETLASSKSLDSALADMQSKWVDLLVLNSEGYDVSALRGADTLLSKGKIGIVLFNTFAAPSHIPRGHLERIHGLLSRGWMCVQPKNSREAFAPLYGKPSGGTAKKQKYVQLKSDPIASYPSKAPMESCFSTFAGQKNAASCIKSQMSADGTVKISTTQIAFCRDVVHTYLKKQLLSFEDQGYQCFFPVEHKIHRTYSAQKRLIPIYSHCWDPRWGDFETGQHQIICAHRDYGLDWGTQRFVEVLWQHSESQRAAAIARSEKGSADTEPNTMGSGAKCHR